MRLLASLLVLLLTATANAAQQSPPARVGRISYASGDLSFRVVGDTQWSQAGVNYPVATGGSFWIDPKGRAEIGIGPNMVDLAGGTELDVVALTEQATQLGLPQGRIFLRVRQIAHGQSVEVDLPQGGVWLLQSGAYDIDTGASDRPGRIQVFDGSARFAGGGADLEIHAGDAAILSGSNPVSARLQPAAADEFVEWCRSRDAERDRVTAPRHVSPQMTGYAELDPYGQWRSSPQHGEVWYPNQVPPGWAPYRDGHWVSVPPWGWTWVDNQPWGFAPSHYGRWAYIDDRWGWVPGRIVPQPVYAPALVAFVSAPVIALGVAAASGPAVGWFPLGPGEVYWPSYTRNTYYIRNVNVTNVRNIDTVVVRSQGAPPRQLAHAAFANRRFATVVPERVFADSGKVGPAAIHIPAARLRQVAVSVQPPRVAPVVRPARVPGPPGAERRHPAAAGKDQASPGAPAARPPSAEEAAGKEKPAEQGVAAPPEEPRPGSPREPSQAPPAGRSADRAAPPAAAKSKPGTPAMRPEAAPGEPAAQPASGPAPADRSNAAVRGNRSEPGKGRSADQGAAAPKERQPGGSRETPHAAPSGGSADRGVSPATAPRPGAEAKRPKATATERSHIRPHDAPPGQLSPSRSAAPRAPAAAEAPGSMPENRERQGAPLSHRPAVARDTSPNRLAPASGAAPRQQPGQFRAVRAPEPVHSAAPRAPVRAVPAPAHPPSASASRAAPATPQPRPHPQAVSKPAPRPAEAARDANKKDNGDKQ